MNRDRFLVPAIVLSALGAAISVVMGLGAGLSEQPGFWFFYVQAALFRRRYRSVRGRSGARLAEARPRIPA